MRSTASHPPAVAELTTHQRQLITAAVRHVTRGGTVPIDNIPRHRAAIHLAAFPDGWRLTAPLRAAILSVFRQGPAAAPYGAPFQPLPLSTCLECGREVVLRPSGWVHDAYQPDDQHPVAPAS